MEDAAKESAANYEKRRARLRGPKADFANKSSSLNASPLAFEKSIGQRKGESIESPNNEAKLGQRIQEVADRHGLTILSYYPIYPHGLPTLKEILESRLQDSVDMVVPFGIKTRRAIFLPPDSSPRSDSFSKSVLGW